MKKLLNILFLSIIITTVSFAQPEVELQQLIVDGGEEDAQFGFSVAMSGDYAIVGARKAGDNREGKIYFCENQAGTWSITQTFDNPESNDDNWFGNSVCINGDYAVAGNYSSSGKAYMYKKNGNTWEYLKELSKSGSSSYYGCSVNISGDYLIVGAYNSATGYAYIYNKDEGGTDNWGEVKQLTASDGANYDRFGHAVAIYQTYAIVGAIHSDIPANQSGSAYIFYKDQGGTDNWGEVKKLEPTDLIETSQFGKSVDICDEYAVVGALDCDGITNGGGVAYVFYKNEGGTDNWGQKLELDRQETINEWDRFGWSVSISNDNILVGSFSTDLTADGSEGAAFLFNKDEGGTDNWGLTAKFTAFDADLYDGFGRSVCLDNDNAIIGASGNDINIENEGAAYIFGAIPPPNCAENPTPENQAEEVLITTSELSWDAVTDATSYELYFGTTTLEFLEEVTEISYPISDLEYNTDYQWQILAKNDVGTAIDCEIWTFTTEIQIPECATNPIPENNATDVSITTAQLTWELVENADSYDVYFGTPTMAYIGNFPDNFYDIPANLELNTNYQWLIIAKNGGGDATGCSVWNFTTEETQNVNNLVNNQFSIYPNPSNGTFTIDLLTSPKGLSNVKITNITGKTIKNIQYSIFNNQFSIKEKGIYFITIKTETDIYTEKVIIQ